jgi:hypothetical protein
MKKIVFIKIITEQKRSLKIMEEKINEESQSIEDNLPMVTYIMLHRIYDLLTLIANKIVDGDETAKMVQYHDRGYLLGPSPSFTPNEEE